MLLLILYAGAGKGFVTFVLTMARSAGFEATGSHEFGISEYSEIPKYLDQLNSKLEHFCEAPFQVVDSIEGVRHEGISISSPFEGLIDTSKAYKALLKRAHEMGRNSKWREG